MCKRHRCYQNTGIVHTHGTSINIASTGYHKKSLISSEIKDICECFDITVLFLLLYLPLTACFRPSSPYSDMSASLPITMVQMLSSNTESQSSRYPLTVNPWPFPHLVQKKYWEKPKGYFKGWAPGDNSILGQMYRDRIPTWLPAAPPTGFSKWIPANLSKYVDEQAERDSDYGSINRKAKADGILYNPVSDPSKITNQNERILEVLSNTFKDGTVNIKNIVLVMLESTREELFPLQQGSDIHKTILKSYEGRKNADDVNSVLSRLTPVAEKITGKSGRWKKLDGSNLPEVSIPQWNDTTQSGFGGINVVGGFTAASLSFKSLAAVLCGVWPIPVDSFEESELQSYQPCIPQILDLFNRMKGNKTASNDFRKQEWLTAFFQSITDRYDRQNVFNNEMGFEEIVTKDVLERKAKRLSELEEVNYFGYPETVLTTHVSDLIEKAKRKNQRIFLSHFTSTTHHPWGLPSDFKKIEYINTRGKMGGHKDFNSYLNTVRFADAWLGEFLQLFEHHGIANETLVVLVGDHGQAFREDISTRTGTYNNGHISNFRVPITFRHPHIPRIQYEANATSISVLPTLLDLLINTNSLNREDTVVASDLLHDYEGQSLIRPYKPSKNGRRAWNFGLINSGASMLSVTSADAPWRLVIPLDSTSRWRFTDLANDPLELQPCEKWSMEQLVGDVRAAYGEEASQWVVEADAIAKWWVQESKRLWGNKT